MRCGTFLCGECTELLGEAAYCASCMAFIGEHGAPPLFLEMALGLEVIALASIPLALVLPLRGLIRVEGAVFAFSLLRGIPVLNGLAAGLGFGAAFRERRRLGRAELPPSASRWLRWVRAGAWVNLGYVLLQAALLAKSFLDFYSGL
ncbi:hypothetical protein JQX13_19340 [Archangium violaceum]|uniref:hypothetical protein n=1 Tax=Archangium violaceum TaxID=83451 RepID=UPI00193BEC45|nr:hypothetical protein [Archangium violaceum]QRK12005.1 hypothetical protein JQX13_19340 [Archangium violaceum]